MSLALSLLADTFSAGQPISDIVSTLTTSADPMSEAVELPAIMEYAAIVTGAVSGGLAGCDHKLDIMGVAVLALVTGLGGGLIRDVILPTSSIYMLDHPLAMILCILLGVAVFFFAGLFYKLDRPMAVADIISVALFAGVGADKALMAGYGFVACVFLGTITAVGGGMLRDICLAKVPSIFRTGNLYAICALAGAIMYVGLVELHCSKVLALVVCVAVVITLRWVSLHYNLVTVSSVDLTPRIAGPFRRAFRRTSRTEPPAAAPADALDGEADDPASQMVTFQDDPAVAANRVE